MKNCCTPTDCSPNDLTGRKAAWYLWYLPIARLLVGLFWTRGRVWVWVPALVVMGLGCLVNAVPLPPDGSCPRTAPPSGLKFGAELDDLGETSQWEASAPTPRTPLDDPS